MSCEDCGAKLGDEVYETDLQADGRKKLHYRCICRRCWKKARRKG